MIKPTKRYGWRMDCDFECPECKNCVYTVLIESMVMDEEAELKGKLDRMKEAVGCSIVVDNRKQICAIAATLEAAGCLAFIDGVWYEVDELPSVRFSQGF